MSKLLLWNLKTLSVEKRLKLLTIYSDKLLKVVEIKDPIGPAGTDEDLTCIVVSKETEKGGFYVNEARKKLKLQPLSVHTIGQGLI